MNTKEKSKWDLLRSPAVVFVLLATTLAVLSTVHSVRVSQAQTARQARAEYSRYQSSYQDEAALQNEEEPEKPPRRRRHHHGPPPPPPGLPPTVVFLIGGALGYLIGKRGHTCGHVAQSVDPRTVS